MLYLILAHCIAYWILSTIFVLVFLATDPILFKTKKKFLICWLVPYGVIILLFIHVYKNFKELQ